MDKKVYPRPRDCRTVHLKNVVTNPNTAVGNPPWERAE